MKTKLLLFGLCAFWNMQGALTSAERTILLATQKFRKAVQDTHSYSPTARGDASKALNYLLSVNTTPPLEPLPTPDDQTLRALQKYGFASKRGRVYPKTRWANRYLFYDIFAGYLFIYTD